MPDQNDKVTLSPVLAELATITAGVESATANMLKLRQEVTKAQDAAPKVDMSGVHDAINALDDFVKQVKTSTATITAKLPAAPAATPASGDTAPSGSSTAAGTAAPSSTAVPNGTTVTRDQPQSQAAPEPVKARNSPQGKGKS